MRNNVTQSLLRETIYELTEYKHTPADVLFVTDGTCQVSWADFAEAAREGKPMHVVVNPELMVVGKDWWLERHVDYGENAWETEWWEHRRNPCIMVYREGDIRLWGDW